MPAPETRTLNAALALRADPEIAQLLTRAASWFDTPPAYVRFSVAAEGEGGEGGADARAYTAQVVDRLGNAWKAQFMVRLWLSATATGGPTATNHSASSFSAGDVWQQVLQHGAWDALTDASGKAVFSVTVTGAADRYPRGIVLPAIGDTFKVSYVA